jgi:hypothetical protein
MSNFGNNLIVTAALVVFATIANAQTSSTGNEIKKADVNMTELANYYKEHPLPNVRKMPIDEDDEEDRPKHHKPHASEIHMLDREARKGVSTGGTTANMPVSIAPIDTFQSSATAGTIIPPDTHGAVDSQYCVTAINTAIHIQTRGGSNVSSVSLDGFWSSVLPAGTGSFDPRVHYDEFNKRWILVTDAVQATTSGTSTTYSKSTILIAVSATNDPTGTWHMYAISVDPSNSSWMDFPNVGYNNRWIMVTGNMFQGSGGAVAYVFNYASIMAGTGAPFTKFTQGTSFSICPALTYDQNEVNLFALENASSSQLKLWKISGATSTPVMTSVGFATAPSTQHWKSGPPGGGDFAPQLGGTGLLNIGDDRITSVIQRNNKLWCSYTAFLPATGTANRSSIMWWQMDTLASPIQIGMVNDPTAVNFYAYSTIAVNKNDDALIGFGTFSRNIHPSAGYALHMATDPLDSTRGAVVYRHGLAYYYETFGGGRNRWGDYSGTCIDPRNDTDFWTIQESSIGGTSPNWDTWWANIQFCPKPKAPNMLSPGPVCIGATATYSVVPVSGATTYVWTVSGTGWSGTASSVDSIHVTVGSGTGTLTVLAYNACGEGEAQVLHIIPTVAPVKPTISINTPACQGSSSAVFVAASSGATSYNWQAVGTGWSGSGGSSALTATVGTGAGMIICTASNACGTSIPDTLIVTPLVTPTVTYSVASHIVNVNANDVVTFTGTAPASSSYTWDFGGGTATPGFGSGPQTIYWSTSGTKTVKLTVDNGGCVASYSDTVHVNDVSGVNELYAGDEALHIMPNPNSGSFKVVFNSAPNKTVSISIIDMQGRTVFTNDLGMTNTKEVAVSANSIAPGNYIVSVNIDGIVATRKITITQ